MCPPDPPVPDTAGELTIRSGVAEFAHYVDGHRVAVDDGTPGSGAVGWILLVGFVLAAVTLVVSHLTFGPRDVYLPEVSSAKQIPAIIVVACLVLIAVFLAAATWHSLTSSAGIGRRFLGPVSLTTLVVVVGNALIGLSLLSTAALLRTRAEIFELQPSLVNVSIGDSDVCLALGVIVLLVCLLLLGVSLLASTHRAVAATLAATPALACAMAYIAADRDVLALSDWAAANLDKFVSPTQAAFILAPPSAQIATSPLLVLVLASAAGIGLLVSFGTVEFVDAKAKISRWLIAGRRVPVVGLVAAIGAVALAVIAGRFGWLPDGEGAAQSFYKEAIDSWVLAVLLAAGGLWMLHASRRRLLEPRNPRAVIAVACVALVVGNIVLFLSRLFQQLAQPLVSSDTVVGRFIFERFPTWALWSQDWVTILAAAGLGLWGLYRLLAQHERSDRVVFAIAFGAVTFQLQLQIVLDVHWASKDLPSFTAATPDQIALCVVAIIAIALLVRRPILDTSTATLVVAVVFLVTLADAVVPNAFSANVFQLLLIAPFAYRFLFDSEESHRDPRAGAITVALFGTLFVAESVAIAVGSLNSDHFETSELSAFFQLTAPLALVMLCATAVKAAWAPPDVQAVAVATGDPNQLAGASVVPTSLPSEPVAPVVPIEPEPTQARTATLRRSWMSSVATGASVLVGVLLVVTLVFSVIRLPGKADRGTYRIDLATLPARYNPKQVIASADAEQVLAITQDASSLVVIHYGSTGGDATLAEPCSDTGQLARFGGTEASPLVPADTIAGIQTHSRTATFQGDNYLVTCAANIDESGAVRLVFVAERDATDLSDDANAIINGLRFSKSAAP